MSFCSKCGKELVNNTSICEFCGADVAQQQVNNQECQQESVYVDPVAAENQYQSAPNQPPYQSAPNQYQYQYSYQANPYYPPTITEDMLPQEYKPVSIGAYLGYSILFSLPIIGWIMLFIVAFGSNYSKSLRNFAKCNLIMIAISTVLVVLFYVFFFVVFGLTASGMMDEFMYY